MEPMFPLVIHNMRYIIYRSFTSCVFVSVTLAIGKQHAV